jgi:hypothetical protein
MSTQEEYDIKQKRFAVLTTSDTVYQELESFCQEFSILMNRYCSLDELIECKLEKNIPLLVSLEIGKEHFLVGGQGERHVILCVTEEEARSYLEESFIQDYLHILVSPFAPLELLSIIRLAIATSSNQLKLHKQETVSRKSLNSSHSLPKILSITTQWMSQFTGLLEQECDVSTSPTLSKMVKEGNSLVALLISYSNTTVNPEDHKEIINLEQRLEDLTASYSARAKSLGLAFSVSAAPLLPQKISFPLRGALDILIKFLDEALDATVQGRVTLDISCNKDNSILLFKIADTGDTSRNRLSDQLSPSGNSDSKDNSACADVEVYLANSLKESLQATVKTSKLDGVGMLVEYSLPIECQEVFDSISETTVKKTFEKRKESFEEQLHLPDSIKYDFEEKSTDEDLFSVNESVEHSTDEDSFELTGPGSEDLVTCELDLDSTEIRRHVIGYINSLPQQLSELSLAIREHDWGRLHTIAREEMKSSQASGFTAFSKLLEQLSVSAAKQEFRKATTILFELRSYSQAIERGVPTSNDDDEKMPWIPEAL